MPSATRAACSRCASRTDACGWSRTAACAVRAASPGCGPTHRAGSAMRDALRYVARAPLDAGSGVRVAVALRAAAGVAARLGAPILPARPPARRGRAGPDAPHPRRLRLRHRQHPVDTPLAQAFAQRRGVCQDFAHLMTRRAAYARAAGALCQRLPADRSRARRRDRARRAPTPRTPGSQVCCPGTPASPPTLARPRPDQRR